MNYTATDLWEPREDERMQSEYAQRVADKKIARRVDTWLDAHAVWVNASPDRQRLAEQWRTCARLFGPESDAACGVLIGLVQQARRGRIAIVQQWRFDGEAMVECWLVHHQPQNTDARGESLLASGHWLGEPLSLWLHRPKGYPKRRWQLEVSLACIDAVPDVYGLAGAEVST